MSNSFAKKAFAVGSTVALAVSTFLPATALAAAHAAGTNVKSTDGTIWMVMPDNTRRAYTSAGAFLSYGFNSFASVVDANADDLALSQGAHIPPQDGAIFCATETKASDVKGECSLITGGQKAAFTSAAVFSGQGFTFANAVYGDSSFLGKTTNVSSATEQHRPGVLVNNNGTVQLVGGTGLLGIPDLATFNTWGYNFGKVVPANAADKALSQTGVMAARTTGQLSPTAVVPCTTNCTPTTSAFNASLASDSPASSTFVAGQATAILGKFVVSGSGNITSVGLKRIGVSSDSTLSNVYLFEGATRLTDSASVTNGGLITFAGLNWPISGSRTLTVRSDIAGSTSGQTVGVQFVSVNGASLSVQPSSNIHTIASATLASVAAGTVTPSGSTINPGASQTLWQSTLTVTQRDVYLKRIAFRQTGSAPASALQNFKLFVNGNQVGSTVAGLDANGYVTFDLSGSTVLLAAGSRLVRLDADVVSGSSRTIQMSVRQAADVDFVDKDYGVNITPTSTPWTPSSAITISGSGGGSMTVQKDTAVASGDVTADATDTKIGQFTFQAFGEAIKLETIKAAFYSSDANINSLRNGRVLVNGVQYGSTATLVTCDTDDDADCDGSDTSGTGTSFTLNYIVPAGQTVSVEVRSDIYDNDGTNSVSANDTLIAAIAVGSSNAVKQDSLGYLSVPASVTLGQTMTAKAASVSLSKNSSYADQTTNIPQTGYKLGDWNLTAGTAEDLIVNTVSLDFTAVSGATFTAADLTNVYVKVGNNTSTVYPSVAATSNTFSIPATTVTKGTSIAVQVFANILSGGITATNSIKATATVTGNSAISGTSVPSSAVDGQTILYNSGSFAISVDGSSPVARAVSGNQEVTGGVYKFQATNDAFTVKEVDVSVSSATVASAVTSVSLYDGATLVATLPFSGSDADSGSNNMASFTGLTWVVNANTSKLLTVKLTLNNIGTGAGTSQQNARVQLDRVRYQDSAGSVTNHTTDYNGNELYVYKAVPTVTLVPVDTTTKIVNGSQRDLYKFTLTAPASNISPNGITVKQFRLALTWNDGAYDGVSGGGNDDTLEVEQVKLLVDGSDVTSSDVTIADDAGNTAESTSGVTYSVGTGDTYLVVSWDAGKELAIGAGQTRTIIVRGIPQGFNVIDAASTPTDSVGFQLAADSAHNSTKVYLNGVSGIATQWGLHTSAAATGSGTIYNFIWSDVSASPHATAENASSSADWANGYKIYDDLNTQQFSD